MAVPARMGKVGSGTVAFGPVRYGSRGTDVMGRVGYGAAGSLQWNGEMGYETERERSGRNLQRCGGDGTHVECLGSRGGDRTGTDGWGLKRSGKVRQSRSLTDSTGAVWWGDLWFGSPG